MTETETPISGPILKALRAAVDRDGAASVAARLGVPRTDPYRWLKDGRMTLTTADKIAAAYGVVAEVWYPCRFDGAMWRPVRIPEEPEAYYPLPRALAPIRECPDPFGWRPLGRMRTSGRQGT